MRIVPSITVIDPYNRVDCFPNKREVRACKHVRHQDITECGGNMLFECITVFTISDLGHTVWFVEFYILFL